MAPCQYRGDPAVRRTLLSRSTDAAEWLAYHLPGRALRALVYRRVVLRLYGRMRQPWRDCGRPGHWHEGRPSWAGASPVPLMRR